MFDDLFEKFFGKKPKNKENGEESKKEENSKPMNLDQLINDVMSSLINDDLDVLDETTNVEYYEDNGLYYKKVTRTTPSGQVTHIIGSSKPFKEKELTYEEQLEIALKDEDYETASILRDKIKSINK